MIKYLLLIALAFSALAQERSIFKDPSKVRLSNVCVVDFGTEKTIKISCDGSVVHELKMDKEKISIMSKVYSDIADIMLPSGKIYTIDDHTVAFKIK